MRTIGSLVLVAAVLLFHAPFQINGALKFPQFHTTFRGVTVTSDVRPTTIQEIGSNPTSSTDMFDEIKDNHSGCPANPSNARYAGYRYVEKASFEPHQGIPNMIIIFDAVGQMAGMQSIIQPKEFEGWDCLENEYYTKDNLTFLFTSQDFPPVNYTLEFCVTTMYFKDPSIICDREKLASAENGLYLQKGNSFKPENLLKFPEKLKEAHDDPENWTIHNWIPGMGHHITPNNHGTNDCKSIPPIQGLYAYKFSHGCINTGFVMQHWNNKVVDHRNGYMIYDDSSEWEKPDAKAVNLILKNPAQCLLDSADKHLAKTMHGFLGGVSKYCITY